jgi:large subunit ribosomal protein L6
MSRVGKLPISIPAGVEVKLDQLNVTVVGPNGTLCKSFKGKIDISLDSAKGFVVSALDDSKQANAMRGTVRSIINNMVTGITVGFSVELEIDGVGYRALLKDQYLNLSLGKSHNTKIVVPKDIEIVALKPNLLLIKSCNKERLGEFVASLIKQRSPEPYKGKGIKVKGSYVQRKEGKKG